MEIYTFTPDDEQKNVRIDKFLSEQLPDQSRSYLQKLLKEGDYTMEAKRRNRKMGAISVVYWLILTAVYLAWSFSTNAWDKTWIVYAVGGVVYAALCVVWELVMNRK